MNAPIPDEALARIKDALARGQTVEAIRLYREHTGAGLAEAAAAVERLEAEARAAGGGSPQVRLVGGVPLGCLVGAVPFVVFGAVFLVAGVRDGLSAWAFLARAERIEGTVVRLDNRIPGQGHSNTECRAVVAYQVGGESHEVHGYVQKQPGVHGGPRGYGVGDAVPLLYDPDRPGEAVVESFHLWAGPLLPGGLGFTFLLLGVGLLWFERRRWRRRREGAEPNPPHPTAAA
jgi:hypothetical protein